MIVSLFLRLYSASKQCVIDVPRALFRTGESITVRSMEGRAKLPLSILICVFTQSVMKQEFAVNAFFPLEVISLEAEAGL